MQGTEWIFTRRSVRQFSQRPVEEEKLHLLLEAAMSGPSCTNARDWAFVAVTDPQLLQKMADANGAPAKPLERAAAGILVCGDLERAFPPRQGLLGDRWGHCGPEPVPLRPGVRSGSGLAGHLAPDGPGRTPEGAVGFARLGSAAFYYCAGLSGGGHCPASGKPLRGKPSPLERVVKGIQEKSCPTGNRPPLQGRAAFCGTAFL